MMCTHAYAIHIIIRWEPKKSLRESRQEGEIIGGQQSMYKILNGCLMQNQEVKQVMLLRNMGLAIFVSKTTIDKAENTDDAAH